LFEMGEKNGFICIGKIVGAHGIRGNVKVLSYAESETVFKPGNAVRLVRPDGGDATAKIAWMKPQNRCILLRMEGISERNQAESAVGSEFFIEKASLSETEEDTYYWADLIGLSVYSEELGPIGVLKSVFRTGSNDVYVVERPDATEILVPALASVVVSVRLQDGMMHVKLPEGLL